eukprot:jgi/Antlo1/1150/852
MLGQVCMFMLICELCKPQIAYTGKRILVLGGSRGLGLALAIELKLQGAHVTILARNRERLDSLNRIYGFETIAADVKNLDAIEDSIYYDLVFSCVGKCVPGYFSHQDLDILENTMRTNFFNTFLALKALVSKNRRPFTFVIVASTQSLYTFPGYMSYAASKSALSMLFEAAKDELRALKITLKIYYTSTVTSEGFQEENTTKPRETVIFESPSYGESCKPRIRACRLLRQLGYRDRIPSDFLTYLMMINARCETLADMLFLPLAAITNQVMRSIISIYFQDIGLPHGA